MIEDLTRVKEDAADLDEALALLALWYSRWQGYTAGTPQQMNERTRTLLTKHGLPPREAPRQ